MEEKKQEAWPQEVTEEEKAKLLLQKAEDVKKKKKSFGKLEKRKEPAQGEKELVDRKLRNQRQFFDSADYFRALQGLRDRPVEADAPSCIYKFKRAEDGTLVRTEVPFTKETLVTMTAPPAQKVGASYFDSADWCLQLHGLLEYPLNTTPHPIMARFEKDQVSIVPHPMHERRITAKDMEMIAAKADEELKNKYSKANMKDFKSNVLKLKLQGRTPHDHKTPVFDSADWSLKLQNVVKKE